MQAATKRRIYVKVELSIETSYFTLLFNMPQWQTARFLKDSIDQYYNEQ